MRKNNKLTNYGIILLVLIGMTVTGCTKTPGEGTELPEQPLINDFLDFSTKQTVSLDIDYQLQGCKTFIELYYEIPYQALENGSIVSKKIVPPFAAYTDENGKFTGKINIPAAVTEVFIKTSFIGLPECIGVNVTNAVIKFKLSDLYAEEAVLSTKANVDSPNGKFPYQLDLSRRLYTLCQWSNKYGKPIINAQDYNLIDAGINAKWIQGLQKTLWGGQTSKPGGLDNSKMVVAEKYTNIAIAKKIQKEDGSIVNIEAAKIDLIFLDEAGWYQNTMGYYYYPSDQKPSGPDQVSKYIIFPNTSTGGTVPFIDKKPSGYNGSVYKPSYAPIKTGQKIELKYFDENGVGHKEFPAGYTIGWFIISDAYNSSNGNLNTQADIYYSNESWNKDKRSRCIALNDKATNRVIIGMEDGGDYSFEDVLFYVESDPREAIIDPDKPSIDDGGEVELPDKTQEIFGTLAFEDVWPYRGDYDMNDIAIEYKQVVTFDHNNMVKKIVDTFKPIHREHSAGIVSTFAFQIGNNQNGTYQLPEGAVFERATNSFILFANEKYYENKEFVVTREFVSGAQFNKEDLIGNNPFIIPAYVPGSTSRIEVHLPKMPPTEYIKKDLLFTNSDAYYIDKDGIYPFAFDLLNVANFELVTEGKKIGSENEYPDYLKWVKSDCKEYTDWYLRKK